MQTIRVWVISEEIKMWNVVLLWACLTCIMIEKKKRITVASSKRQQIYKKGMKSSYHWVWRAYLNMPVHYLKIEVPKYIYSLLRVVFKKARPKPSDCWISFPFCISVAFRLDNEIENIFSLLRLSLEIYIYIYAYLVHIDIFEIFHV